MKKNMIQYKTASVLFFNKLLTWFKKHFMIIMSVNRSYYFTLIITMILFVTIPILIVYMVSGKYMRQYSQQSIAEVCVEKVNVLGVSAQNIIDSMNTAAQQFCLSDTVRSMTISGRYSDIFSNPQYILDANAVKSMLENFVQINKLAEKATLYIKKTDYYISSDNGVTKLKNLEALYWYRYINEYDTMQSVAENVQAIYSYGVYYDISVNKFMLVYCYNLKFPDVMAYLVTEIEEESISSFINLSKAQYSESVFISDGERIISHVDKSLLGVEINEIKAFKGLFAQKKEAGYEIRKIDGERKIISYHLNPDIGWYIIDVTSLKNVVKNISGHINYMAVMTIVIVIAGIMLSIITSTWIYNPIKKFILNLYYLNGMDIKNSKNEFTFIARAFNELKDQKEKLELFYKNHISDVRTRYLRSFLTGNHDSLDNINSKIIDMNLPFFYCICIYIDKYTAFSNQYEAPEQFYIKNRIINIAKEEFNDLCRCWGIIFDNRRIAIIANVNEIQLEILNNNLITLCTKIQERVMEFSGHSLSIGISSAGNSLNDLGTLFNQSNEALREKFICGYGKSYLYSDSRKEMMTMYPKKEEDYFFNCLKNSPESIETAINQIVDAICSTNQYTIHSILIYIHQLIGRLSIFLMDEGIVLDSLENYDISLMSGIEGFENINEFRQWMLTLCLKTIESKKNKLQLHNVHYQRIVEYLKQNYSRDIDLTSVAEDVGLSYSYVRQVFRNNSNLSITEYINSLRISKSCELLVTTNMNIKDIALQVGYNNLQSFSRFFKNQEGISPREYKVIYSPIINTFQK